MSPRKAIAGPSTPVGYAPGSPLTAGYNARMPTYFPCPNAQCSYQFDADMLPAAAMVTCPLCRTRFPYRANRPVPTAAGPAAGADDPRPAGPRVVRLRDVPRGGGVLTTIAWVGGFAIVVAGVVAAVTLRGRTGGPDEGAREARLDERFNLRVEPFPAGFGPDTNAPQQLEANVMVRKRANPDGWVAVAARDWADRQPRAGELDEFFRGRLRSAFRTLETEAVEGAAWAGRPATGVRFTGTLDGAQVRGEAYAMAEKGVGYVFLAWAAEADWAGLRDELVGLREKVTPAGFRDAWVEKRSGVTVYEGEGFQLEDPDGAWVRAKPADEWKNERVKYVLDNVKDVDPAAVMAFLARYQIRERGDALRQSPEAKALVVELPGGGDPLEAAKANALERVKRDFADGVPEGLALEPMPKSPTGIQLPTGGPAIGRFRLKNPKASGDEEVWVISAITVGDKVVAVQTNVLEKNASYVEEWMVRLAGSLKAK